MDFICPLCNGLKKYKIICPQCGSKMIDDGALINFLDDYSPYLSNDITQLVDGVSHDKCTHIFTCKKCNEQKRFKIQRVRM